MASCFVLVAKQTILKQHVNRIQICSPESVLLGAASLPWSSCNCTLHRAASYPPWKWCILHHENTFSNGKMCNYFTSHRTIFWCKHLLQNTLLKKQACLHLTHEKELPLSLYFFTLRVCRQSCRPIFFICSLFCITYLRGMILGFPPQPKVLGV